jgi:GNAT superfamily N-acetyltransferase
MPYIVLPAQPPDTTAVYDAYFAAFANSRLPQILFPSAYPPIPGSPSSSPSTAAYHPLPTAEFREGHTAHTLTWVNSPASKNQYTFKTLDTSSGEVVGMALWDVHFQDRPEVELKWPGVEWLEGEERRRAEELLGPLVDVKEKLVGGRAHIYCHTIAVHPSHQRKGIGKKLVRWGAEMGEELGVPVYLESSAEGVELYRELGFKQPEGARVVHSKKVLGGEEDVEVPVMVRMPSGEDFGEWLKRGKELAK